MADAPHFGSVKPGRWLGLVLYALLGVAAGMALLGGSYQVGSLWIDRTGIAAFAVFLVVFAAYRFALVRAGRYSLGKALYQLGAGLLLLVVLGSGTLAASPPAEVVDLVGYLLGRSDPHVRRAGCELARLRGAGSALAVVQAHASEANPEVAAECARAAAALGGTPGR
jgi:hypothetical protein